MKNKIPYRLWRPTLVFFLCFSIITGLIYPLTVSIVGQLIFPKESNGSLITSNHKVIGSRLIGQNFTRAKYFWGRLSATASFPYNALASGGSNYGPLNPKLIADANARISALHAYGLIPVTLITASASGLDPDISPAAALYQIPRIAQTRNVPADKIKQLVMQHIKSRKFNILGNSRVNVLELNLALDKLTNE